MENGIAERKATLRKAAQATRARAHASAEPEQGARVLGEVLADHASRVLSGYMPMRSEIDPLPAMAAHEGPVCVPVIAGRGLPLRFREWSPDAALEEGPFGARIPVAGAWMEPHVLIVPLLAFDRRGFRLGYGGGFYDRTLARLRARGSRLALGFAYAAQEVAAVPIEETDQPLDLIVTEAGVITPRG